MFESGSSKPAKTREFIHYNEKGEPVVLRSNVEHESLHPAGLEENVSGPLTSDVAFEDSDPWTPKATGGSMRFFGGAKRFTETLGKK
jgi:hypothetical protein